MKTIDGCSYAEYEIKRSKFICFVDYVSNIGEVNSYLEKYRKQYSDSTHICYAYVLSSPAVEKCSDDGEPSGTAGKPMLEMLKKQGLSNAMVVVIRYFGGIKLGAGGLVRAYANTVRQTLEIAKFKNIVKCWICKIVINLDQKYNLERGSEIKILDIDYSQIANKKLCIKAAIQCKDNILNDIKNISDSVEIIDEVMM